MTNIEKAFLDTIAYVEGTLGVSKNGYDVSVGFNRIVGWTEDTKIVHGNQEWLNRKLNSTATGRYQFTYKTWLGCNNMVNKPMNKVNQDMAALFLLNDRKPKNLIISTISNKNNFEILVNELKKSTWTGFKQKTIDDSFSIFEQALAEYNKRS